MISSTSSRSKAHVFAAVLAVSAVACFSSGRAPAQELVAKAPAPPPAPLMPITLAGDAGRGVVLATTCGGCHGVPGSHNVYPSYHVPKLGGQNPGYIVAALKAYKAGERNHATMKAIASSLSEQDMADLAAYYADAGKK